MKTALSLFILCVAAVADPISDPCTIDLFTDGQGMDASCFGQPLNRTPGSTWQIGLEDLPAPFSDFDGNDLVALVTFTNTQALFTYQGDLSVLYDEFLVNGASVFNSWYTGLGDTFDAPINSTIAFRAFYPGYWPVSYQIGSPNVYTACLSGCVVPVPEPGYTLMAGAALLVVLRRRR